MTKKAFFVIAVLFVFILMPMVLAQTEDEQKAISLVEKAVDFYNANGRELALKELSNPKSKFVDASFYIFAYDLEGVLIAHPFKPDLIGKNLMEEPDSKGKLFRKEIVQMAKEKGSGWVDYMYTNPKTNKEEAKTTYFKKADSIIFCCGIYKQ